MRGQTSFLEHRTNWSMVIYWWSNSNTLFLALNNQTLNFEPNRAFIRFTKLLIEPTRTSFFQTSHEIEHVHLLVIELKYPIFGFKWSNIELQTLFDPSIWSWTFSWFKLSSFGTTTKEAFCNFRKPPNGCYNFSCLNPPLSWCDHNFLETVTQF